MNNTTIDTLTDALTDTTEAVSLAGRLRVAANIVEGLPPGVPTPAINAWTTDVVELLWILGKPEATLCTVRDIRKAIGGCWTKRGGDQWFVLERRAVGGIKFTVQVEREQICERIVVGTETVVVPAVEARPERTEVREVVEWRCEPLTQDAGWSR